MLALVEELGGKAELDQDLFESVVQSFRKNVDFMILYLNDPVHASPTSKVGITLSEATEEEQNRLKGYIENYKENRRLLNIRKRKESLITS